MGVVSTLAAATNTVQVGASVLSLVGATKALVKPLNEVEGIDGLLFDIPENEQVNLTAQITDHVVEDNSSMQDHIAIAPVKITLTGKIGELVMTKSRLQSYAETILTILTTLPIISPAMSESAMRAISVAIRAQQAIEQTIKKARDMKALLTGEKIKTKQQEYYFVIKQMFYGRGLFSVQTPWETFDNMAIESVNFDQDETTNTIMSVTISLKQVTLAQTKTTTGKLKGRIALQKQPEVQKGKARGMSLAKELAGKILSAFGG